MSAQVPQLAAFLAGGWGLGVLYFASLWWRARAFGRTGHLGATLAVMAGRFLLLAGILGLVSLAGAVPLLITALGLLIGRSAVMRRVRQSLA